MLVGKPVQGGADSVPGLAALRRLLGRVAAVRQVHAVQIICAPVALLPPQAVDGGVGGQAVQPCGEPAVAAEAGQAPPCGQERLLRRVLRQRRIAAAHTQRQPVHLLPPADTR